MTHKPTLHTARLRLRPARPGDEPLLLALDTDPEVRRYVDQPDAPTLESSAAVLARFLAIEAESPALGFWMAEAEGAFIGWFHLKGPRPGEPALPGDLELGYRLLRSAWGQGYATEGSQALITYAFEVLGAPRVTAVADLRNTASIGVMAKCGLEEWTRWRYPARAGGTLELVVRARRAPGSPT